MALHVNPENADNLESYQKGTLFPTLDGTTPGDLTDKPQDISGQVLPDLRDDPPSQIASGDSLSMIPGDRPGLDTPEGEPVAGGEIEAPAERRGRRSASDRIAQLTKKYRQEQDARTGLEVQLSTLMGKLEEQAQMIQKLSVRSPSASGKSANTADDPSGLGVLEGDAPQPAPASDIAAVVTKAIEAYDARKQRQVQEQESLKSAHVASFQEAAEEFPELNDSRTRAHKLFMQLYNTSPLRVLPDAPYQLALQVRGILADEAANPRANPAALEARKRQASIVPSRPASTSTELPGAQRAAAQKELATLQAQMKAGDQDPRTYIRWRKLRAALRNNG